MQYVCVSMRRDLSWKKDGDIATRKQQEKGFTLTYDSYAIELISTSLVFFFSVKNPVYSAYARVFLLV